MPSGSGSWNEPSPKPNFDHPLLEQMLNGLITPPSGYQFVSENLRNKWHILADGEGKVLCGRVVIPYHTADWEKLSKMVCADCISELWNELG